MFISNKELPFTLLLKKKYNESYLNTKKNINNSIKDIISSNLSPNKKKSDSNLKSGVNNNHKVKSTFSITIKNPSSNSIIKWNRNSIIGTQKISFIRWKITKSNKW